PSSGSTGCSGAAPDAPSTPRGEPDNPGRRDTSAKAPSPFRPNSPAISRSRLQPLLACDRFDLLAQLYNAPPGIDAPQHRVGIDEALGADQCPGAGDAVAADAHAVTDHGAQLAHPGWEASPFVHHVDLAP